MLVSLSLATVACLGAAGLYLERDLPPACDSEPAVHRVTDILRDQFRLDGLFVNNIRTVSGGLLASRNECSAEVATIRGNVNASDMPWRAIMYQIIQRDDSEHPVVSVQLGDAVPLAKPTASLWERLFGHR